MCDDDNAGDIIRMFKTSYYPMWGLWIIFPIVNTCRHGNEAWVPSLHTTNGTSVG